MSNIARHYTIIRTGTQEWTVEDKRFISAHDASLECAHQDRLRGWDDGYGFIEWKDSLEAMNIGECRAVVPPQDEDED